MANLKAGTSIGGHLVFHSGNFNNSNTAMIASQLDVADGMITLKNMVTAKVSSHFVNTNTNQNYIYFGAAVGSNDPGFIMQETGDGDDANKAVLHICPSDDNSSDDYIAIHGTNDPEAIKLRTDGSAYFSGKVGILNSSPAVSLDVSGGANIYRSEGGEILSIKSNSDTHGYMMGYIGATKSWYIGNGSNASEDLYIASYSNKNINLYTGATRLTIQSDGKVGINTTAPAEYLDIVGNLKITPTSSPGVTINNGWTSGYTLGGEAYTNKVTLRINGTTADIALMTKDDEQNTAGFNIDGGLRVGRGATILGNVGIGKDSPAQKLDVVGSVKLSDVLYVQDGAAGMSKTYYDEPTYEHRIYPASSSNSALSVAFKMMLYYYGSYKEVWHEGNVSSFLRNKGTIPNRNVNDALDQFGIWSADTGGGDVTNTPLGTLPSGSARVPMVMNVGYNSSRIKQFYFESYATGDTQLWMRGKTGTNDWDDWKKIWNAGNDGAESGLDADMLDGVHLSTIGGYGRFTYSSDQYQWTKIGRATSADSSHGFTITVEIENTEMRGTDYRNDLRAKIYQHGTNLFIKQYNEGNYTSPVVVIGAVKISDYVYDIYVKHRYYSDLKAKRVFADAGTFVEAAKDASFTYTDRVNTEPTGIAYASPYTMWHSGNDGSGSGLDADKIDGLDSSQFLRSDVNDTAYGTISWSNKTGGWGGATGAPAINFTNSDVIGFNTIVFNDLSNSVGEGIVWPKKDNPTTKSDYCGMAGLSTGDPYWSRDISTTTYYKMWHQGNDGSGSGLDADLLDGTHLYDISRRLMTQNMLSSGYWKKIGKATITAQYGYVSKVFSTITVGDGNGHLNNSFAIFEVKQQAALGSAPVIRLYHHYMGSAGNIKFGYVLVQNDSSATVVDLYAYVTYSYTTLEVREVNSYVSQMWSEDGTYVTSEPTNIVYANNNRLLTTGDEGSGNGIDADTVDALHASSFCRKDTNITGSIYTNTITVNNAGTTNIDHIWHDDSNNTWYFNSDTSWQNTAATGNVKANNVYVVGNLGIGTTSPSEKLDVSGNIVASGTGTATDWIATSDRRLKENIKYLPSQLDKVNKVGKLAVRYNLKADSDKRERIGFVAQELEEIYPEFVFETDNEEKTKAIDYAKMVAPLYNAISELNDIIQTQNEKINSLEKIVSEQQEMLNK